MNGAVVSAVPTKKRMPLWAKILIVVTAIIGIVVVAVVGFLVFVLSSLGNAGTEYNTVVTKEASRIKTAVAISACPTVDGDEVSHGNVDAIERYRFDYTCTAVPTNLSQQLGDKLATLGYVSTEQGIYTNACCEIQLTTSTSGYTVSLYSNKVDGRDHLAN